MTNLTRDEWTETSLDKRVPALSRITSAELLCTNHISRAVITLDCSNSVVVMGSETISGFIKII